MANSAMKHWTVVNYFRPVLDYLRARQIPLQPYLELLGLEEHELRDPDRRIGNHVLPEVMALAEQQCGDSNIGLHMGQTMQVHHMGIVGLLIMNCRYAHEMFDLHTRYQTLVGNGLNTEYLKTNGELCMQVSIPKDHPPLGRHDFEFSLAGWFQLLKQIAGNEHKALRVELPYAKPQDDAELLAMFSCPVSYDHEVLRIFFRPEHLELELLAGDPQLKQILETQARKRSQDLLGEQADSDPQLAKVRQLIANRLAYCTPSLDEVAEEMAVSVRTLQRRLDARECNYKQLLDQVRADLAGKYIENKDLSLLDVAMMLGFAEQSSFARAFKRWFGDAPGAYRRQALAELSE